MIGLNRGDIQLVTERPETGSEVLKLVSGETVYVTAIGGAVESLDYQAFVDWLVSGLVGQQLLTLSWMVHGSRFQRPPKKLLRLRWPLSEIFRMARVVARPCRRCHKVDRADKYAGIDNAPSFHAMRSFDDWYIRFSTFYAVSPHKALISVEGSGIEKDRALITIAPIDLKMDDINDIVAFVHSLTPLDLGKPIQFNP